MKELVLNLVNEYLKIFPNENDRQENFLKFLNCHENEQITDWNNFDGHIVAGGFIFAKKEQKFLVIYHNDLNMYLYPGGHIDKNDENPLEAAKREVIEETGINNIEEVCIANDKMVPIDIDTHVIDYNKRLDLPEHQHFEFRYLFFIDKIENVTIDTSESSKFKWISKDELRQDKYYGKIVKKFDLLMD